MEVSSPFSPASQLVFNNTNVPYGRDSLYTSSTFFANYFNLATLVSSGRTFLIQPSTNTSLCLTFSNITTGMSLQAIAGMAGLVLRFAPCKYVSATATAAAGQPAHNNQVSRSKPGLAGGGLTHPPPATISACLGVKA